MLSDGVCHGDGVQAFLGKSLAEAGEIGDDPAEEFEFLVDAEQHEFARGAEQPSDYI